MDELAPVALFAFNRPEHLSATLEALRQNDLAAETNVTVFCDGARSQDDHAAVAAVRRVAHQASGFNRVAVVERDNNFGLARSVIAGVSAILSDNEAVIVVEDDLVTSPFFLAYMNEGLTRFANVERVISICGYTYPTDLAMPEVFFMPGAHCWGWATWRRGWDLFEHDPQKCLDELLHRDLVYKFDVDGTAPHTLFMQRAAAGEADSWALRWMASAILNDRLSLYPGTSMVQNIGNEGSGTNASKQDAFQTRMSERQPRIEVDEPTVNMQVFADYRLFLLRGYWQHGLIYRVYYKLLKLLPSVLERRLYTMVTSRMLRRFGH